MHDAQVIVLATPVFFALIALEIAIGWRRGEIPYAWSDTLNSIGLGVLSQLVGVFTKLFAIGLYQWVYAHAALFSLSAGSPWVWIGALLGYDLLYYWLHRLGHTVAVLWAAHVVHHQSEEYNLSTALRQTGSGWLLGWLFYLPLAIVGVPPLVFAVVALIDLLYQFWVHTRLIDRLGWFDRWFCAPSNHRVHHAVNDVYLDRNFGGILIAWDRLFGSWQPELASEPCIYGTRSPLRSWNPLWANIEVYAALWHDCRHARRWRDKAKVWFMPPGWRPDDVAARFPKPPFALGAIPRYAPPLTPGRRVVATALFLAAVAATTHVLWHAHELAPLALAGGSGAVLGLLCAVGWLCEGRSAARVQPGSDPNKSAPGRAGGARPRCR